MKRGWLLGGNGRHSRHVKGLLKLREDWRKIHSKGKSRYHVTRCGSKRHFGELVQHGCNLMNFFNIKILKF